MKRSTLNAAVDTAAFGLFAFLATTGVLIRWTLPPGSGRRTTVWGLDRHGWGDLHFWVAAAFLGVLSLHLLLHGRFLAGLVRGRAREGSGGRLALGLVALATLVALAAAPLCAPVETAPRPGRGPSGPPGRPAPDAPR
jgi:hypothetical protein